MFRAARRPWRAIVLLASFWVMGCKVGPDYQPPDPAAPSSWSADLPENWSTDGGVGPAWWTALEDPLLDELIERAFRSSPRLASAAARIEEVRAQRGLRVAELFPDVDASTTARKFRNSANGVNSNVSGFQFDDRTLYSLGVETSWEVDFWGRVRRGVEAATADFEATIEDWRDALVLLQAEVARAYVDLRLAQAHVRIARSNSRAQEESLRIARARFEAGLTSEADATRAGTLLSQTQASLDSLATDVAAARNRLAVLVGEFPGALDDLLRDDLELPELPTSLAVGMPHELLRRRPDVRGAERRLAAQSARIGLAEADLYPSLSLNGSFSYESADRFSLFEGESEAFSIGPFLRWNVLEFGRIFRAIDVERARTDRLLSDYEETVLRAAEEVERALHGLANEERRTGRMAAARAQASRSVEILRIEYEEGLTDYQGVLDAERTLLQIEEEVARARASTLRQFIALFEALGGGWEAVPNVDLAAGE